MKIKRIIVQDPCGDAKADVKIITTTKTFASRVFDDFVGILVEEGISRSDIGLNSFADLKDNYRIMTAVVDQPDPLILILSEEFRTITYIGY